MHRVLMCAAAGALFISSQAVAQEKVSFPSTDGTTLTGYLYKPTGSGPFAAVVGMHGCNGVVNDKGEIDPLYGQWGEILSSKGYYVLLVDGFRPRGQSNLCLMQPISIRPILPWKETVRDTFGGLNYLRSRPDVRPDSIGIMGQSYGGMAMMFTIADGALPKDQNDFRFAVAFYPNCPEVLNRDAHWRPRQRMLLLSGELDGFTPACKEIIARAQGGPPIEAHFYPDTYHAFDHPNQPVTVTDVKLPPDGHPLIVGSNPQARADAINRVTEFLAKQLQ